MKVKKSKIANKNVAELFNHMMGLNGINISIAYPRYKRIEVLLRRSMRLFDLLSSCKFMADICPGHKLEVEAFTEASRDEIDKFYSFTMEDLPLGAKPNPERAEQFTRLYEEAKRTNCVNSLLVTCDRLVPYRHELEKEDCDGKFIELMPGVSFKPFPFTKFDVKQIYIAADDGIRRLLVKILHKCYMLSYDLYKEVSAPDIDVDEFVDCVVNSLDEIRKHPQLSRCGKAINKMKNSVELLRNNFDNYYRDFVESKNQMIIMENFIIDISTSSNVDPETMRQFRHIINFYRSKAGQIQDPRIREVFDHVDKKYKHLERNLSNLRRSKQRDTDADPNAAPDEPAGDRADIAPADSPVVVEAGSMNETSQQQSPESAQSASVVDSNKST